MTMSNKESRRLYSGGQMRPITPPFPITFTFFFLADAFLSKRFARGCVRCIGTKGSVFVCRLNMQWSAGVRMSLSVIKHMPCEHVLPITDFMVCVCVWAYVCVVALRICAWNYTLVGKAKCPLASVCLCMCVKAGAGGSWQLGECISVHEDCVDVHSVYPASFLAPSVCEDRPDVVWKHVCVTDWESVIWCVSLFSFQVDNVDM